MKANIARAKGDRALNPIEATFVEVEVDVIDFNANKRTISCPFQLTFDEALEFFTKGTNLATYASTFEEERKPEEKELTISLYRTAIDFIADLLCTAWGKFDDDGLSFVKEPKFYWYFKGSVMLRELIRRILNEEDFFEEFRNKLLPSEFMQQVTAEKANAALPASDNIVPIRPEP